MTLTFPAVMYDAVTAGNMPGNGQMYAFYVDGLYANGTAVKAHAPGKFYVPITIGNTAAQAGYVLDVETGDATAADAVAWCTAYPGNNTDLVVYCNTSTWPSVRAAFQAAKITEPNYWVAEYDNDPTVPAGAAAKQYATGGYDTSRVVSWPGATPTPSPAPPAPVPTPVPVPSGSGLPLILNVSTTVPTGVTWPGDVLLSADGTVSHIVDPAGLAAFEAAGLKTASVSYRQYAVLKTGVDPGPGPTPVTPPVTTQGQIPTSMVDFSGAGSWNSGTAACAGYIEQACAVLGITGSAVQNWVTGGDTMASRESASNSPQWQVNTTDSNAVGAIQSDGAPFQCSRGVAQCIPQTFAQYHAAGTSYKIYDPVASFAASFQYVMARYGVSKDGSNLAANVQQFDPSRSPQGY